MVALAAPATPAHAASASVSIGLADAPSSPKDPRAAFYVVDAVAPGTTLERAVRVRNDGTEAVTVDLYVGSASIIGQHLTFADRAGDHGDLATWASVDPGRVTVAPGGTADATARFAVPDGASPGERLGVVWAQPPATGGSTNVVNRVGVRVYLAVDDDGAPASDFTVDAVTASRDASGAPVLTATVSNTGGRAIEPLGTVVPAGGGPTPFTPGLALLPRQRGRTPARLAGDVGDAPVHVTVVLSANGVERRVQATVTFPREPGASAPPVELSSDSDGPSKALPAAIAALVGVVVLIGTARARRRGR